jgi:protein tyrosine phosphatase (PTP) superfamily phosphohydrolase (DUF442 family)
LSIKNIFNFYQLSKKIATAGQPTADQFKLIKDNRYEIIINTAAKDYDLVIPNEGEIIQGLGLLYVNIPVILNDPKIEQYYQFRDLMNLFEGKKIFLHCAKNIRVSAFCYLYFTSEKSWEEEKAKTPIFRAWQPDEAWKSIIKQIKGE